MPRGQPSSTPRARSAGCAARCSADEPRMPALASAISSAVASSAVMPIAAAIGLKYLPEVAKDPRVRPWSR